jgi:hypothetical protein
MPTAVVILRKWEFAADDSMAADLQPLAIKRDNSRLTVSEFAEMGGDHCRFGDSLVAGGCCARAQAFEPLSHVVRPSCLDDIESALPLALFKLCREIPFANNLEGIFEPNGP